MAGAWRAFDEDLSGWLRLRMAGPGWVRWSLVVKCRWVLGAVEFLRFVTREGESSGDFLDLCLGFMRDLEVFLKVLLVEMSFLNGGLRLVGGIPEEVFLWGICLCLL